MKYAGRAAAVLLLLGGFIGAPSLGAQNPDILMAVQTGNLNLVKEFAAKDPAVLKWKNEGDDTLLHYAAGAGTRPVLEYLLSQGLDVNVKNSTGQTPLLYAAFQGHTAIVALLIDKGADFKYQDARGMTPLHFAARQGRKDVIALLLGKGASPELKSQEGRTPVDLAVLNGQAEAILTFLQAGLLDPKSEMGSKALHALVAAGRREAAAELVQKGADIGVKAPDGKTMIHSAAAGGLEDWIDKALAGGQDIKAKDNAGRTALYYAVRSGRVAIVDLLLKRGADPNADVVDGRTLLHLAEDRGDDAILAALKKAGAADRPRAEIPLEMHPAPEGSPAGQVTYIANEGFRISTKTKTILVDALVRNPWGYDETPASALDRMIKRMPPYEKIDLLLFSHEHADHFNAAMAVQILEAHPEAVLVGNEVLRISLEREAKDKYAALSPRVKIFNPAWGQTIETTIGGVALKIMPVNHAEFPQEYQTLAYLIKADGLTFFHLGDSVPQANKKFFETFGLEKAGIDIAFLDTNFMNNPDGLAMLPTLIKPDKIVLMHLRRAEVPTVGLPLAKAHPNLILFHDVSETRAFRKAGRPK